MEKKITKKTKDPLPNFRMYRVEYAGLPPCIVIEDFGNGIQSIEDLYRWKKQR